MRRNFRLGILDLKGAKSRISIFIAQILLILRYREQWIAWYISTILETVINIMSGQWMLLILKVGYLTNTTYGYIKWTKYIKSAKQTQKQDSTANQPVSPDDVNPSIAKDPTADQSTTIN